MVLRTLFTDETTTRVCQAVRTAAEQAGRDPAAVRVWSCFATIGDHLPEPVRLKKTVGRMGTYLQAYGDLMVRTNDWDPAAPSTIFPPIQQRCEETDPTRRAYRAGAALR